MPSIMRLSEKEKTIAVLKLQGYSHHAIAKKLGKTDADISQTIARTTKKIVDVQSSLDLLEQLKIIKSASRINFTDAGKALVASRQLHHEPIQRPRATECDLWAVLMEYKRAYIDFPQNIVFFDISQQFLPQYPDKTIWVSHKHTLRGLKTMQSSYMNPVAFGKAQLTSNAVSDSCKYDESIGGAS